MRAIAGRRRTLIEGATGVAAAPSEQRAERHAGKDVVLVPCERTSTIEFLERIL